MKFTLIHYIFFNWHVMSYICYNIFLSLKAQILFVSYFKILTGVKEEHQIDSFGSSPKVNDSSVESVVFIHGFLSSSSMWVETVFPNLSQVAKQSFRMIAVDLLGFGRSPKPTNCTYTLKDHLQMMEKSLLTPLQLNSYHIVAHSMGCVIALAQAASSPDSIKSITLIAPVSTQC